ncbi:orotate phosphoribosyltransferase [Priestia endophytica]|jgi:orotate phosphoribosyltransferase|uniref:Orotate phosphoribosyltransferase n=2 Tax=Priestia endophytica TaxID=135735 RepID=A0AAX1QD37_9BACI|nr:orotate phosphoribosyltransferase [Priestia endophytica]KYG35821.1 orotate phosphoribosyltransferase [Priestia endophytica]MBG9814767.1 orotate phosphoribosyltransferase [Priestia endophytica]MCM3539339.1 orotate phosphoribosyltransferase [Priestia endophytica]RAS79448.1 orotate phosphoribosyltransferase [Priestia endophytica]RAS79827.1 orotate phosphoribosyltransferase [Priestia endophytica]
MKKKIAQHLLTIEAVCLQPNDPFTWASGIKSPIYCDNRLTLSYPEVRQDIAQGLASLIRENFKEVDVIAGTATAGIPHAAFVSDVLSLPMCYVRSKAKEHGRGNQIEGRVTKGDKVVVVEDLISTGGSVLKVVKALEEQGCEVLGVVSIFTYELSKAEEAFKEANVTLKSLSNYSTLIEVAREKGSITETDLEKLKEWKKDPSSTEWLSLV